MSKKAGKKKKLFNWKALIFGVTFCVVCLIANLFYPLKYIFCLFVSQYEQQEGAGYIRFLDVGYGECTIVQLPDGQNMLIDGGNDTYQNRVKVLKYLNRCDIQTIDYLICTSVKGEDCGAITEIMKMKKVKRIYYPYCTYSYITDQYHDFSVEVSNSDAELFINEYGVHAEGENWSFVMLSPEDHTLEESEYTTMNSVHGEKNMGNASAVIWLEIYDTKILLTGDITYTVAQKICNSYDMCLSANEKYCPVNGKSVMLDSCDIFTVPAHGSLDGRYAQFYKLLNAQTAIISVGENNRSCPSIEVLSDVGKVTDKIYVTEYYGTVPFVITSTGYSLIE